MVLSDRACWFIPCRPSSKTKRPKLFRGGTFVEQPSPEVCSQPECRHSQSSVCSKLHTLENTFIALRETPECLSPKAAQPACSSLIASSPENALALTFSTLHGARRSTLGLEPTANDSPILSAQSQRDKWGLRDKGANMRHLLQLWRHGEGQNIAEYAVMLAVILVVVVSTIRLIGTNANTVFSSAASSIQ